MPFTLSSGLADDTSIFTVGTVVDTESSVGAVDQSSLTSDAAHIIQEDESGGTSLSISSPGHCSGTCVSRKSLLCGLRSMKPATFYFLSRNQATAN